MALVHDWLVARRGGEKVLEALCALYPAAELFTLLYEPGTVGPEVESHRIHTSFLQRVPHATRVYRHLLPLMPAAVEQLDLRGMDLVLSSSHCVAKGVRVPAGVPHLSYVHAPMRYMWDRFDDYFGPGRASLAVRAAALAVRPALQWWDRRSARGVHRFVANSRHVAGQIRRHYGREAAVVHPPVELERFAASSLEGTGRGGYFLWAGAVVPNKRLDLALAAFRSVDAPLWVAGYGTDDVKLARGAPRNVRWLGPVADDALAQLYRDARALVFPGVEDFGITPLEAQASGRPVIAFAEGGALESVIPGQTGLFFSQPTPEGLTQALHRFEAWEAGFDPAAARRNALRFSRAAFMESIREQVALLPARG